MVEVRPSQEVFRGLCPGMVLLPAREYSWRIMERVSERSEGEEQLDGLPLSQQFSFTLPNKGSLKALLAERGEEGKYNFGEPDEFQIWDGEFIAFWDLLRVAFATGQYPDLSDNQCASVTGLSFHEDEIVVHFIVMQREG